MRLTETRIRQIVRGVLQESAAPLPTINIDRMKPALDALMRQALVQLQQTLSEELAQMETRLSDPDLPAHEAGDAFDEVYYSMLTKTLSSPPPAVTIAVKLMRSLLGQLTRRLSTNPDAFASTSGDEEDDEGVIPITASLCEIVIRDLLESTPWVDLATWRGINEPPGVWLQSVFYSHVNELVDDEVHSAVDLVMRAQRSRSFLDHAHAQIATDDLARRFASVQMSGRSGEPHIILCLQYIASSSIKPKVVTAQAILDKMLGGSNESSAESAGEEET
jgi:hypothetical protein